VFELKPGMKIVNAKKITRGMGRYLATRRRLHGF
jgi:hypothetical protein